MAKRLFGTDGIRGRAGQSPLDPQTVFEFGLALGADLHQHSSGNLDRSTVLIGMDTRESGPWISEFVAGGLQAQGVRVRSAGVITTPGVAYLTQDRGFSAGVMISASHNPFEDNGLKVFASTGFKLPDEEESLVEESMLRLQSEHRTPAALATTVEDEFTATYLDHLLSTIDIDLDGMSVVLDCGNGAASQLAPELFRRAGADVTAIHNHPDGLNINLNCGALHVKSLSHEVVARRAFGGAAFDGDADRCMLISESGKLLNGDAMLLIAARYLRQQNHLNGDLVVSTVMANLGLEHALAAENIRMTRTPVGDKYVLEEMLRTQASVGGEQSGHVIFREYASTGDGMLTALQILQIARKTGQTLGELASSLTVFPQRLVNVRVKRRERLENLPKVHARIRNWEARFNGNGRILVRYSGTEALLRVMVEGADERLVEESSEEIAAAIREELA